MTIKKKNLIKHFSLEDFKIHNGAIRMKNDDNVPVFFMVYTDWCPHCQNAFPDMIHLYSALNSDKLIRIGVIDSEQQKVLSKMLGVAGFPSYFLFSKGKTVNYNGKRDMSSILDWLCEQTKVCKK